ncbi:MAG: T9SS type A sorting domain-containing protein [Bacteroidales bacterium]|nr:T9SS type A sorting domain-containing protein [Bacteroidales bacterium]
MKKICLLTIVIMMTVLYANAQSSLVGTGGEATGNGGSVSFSVGQIAVQSNGDGTTTISEGVQQPYEISVSGVDNYPNITLNAVVYPNPTLDIVRLTIDNFDLQGDNVSARLFDGNGKLIKELRIADCQTEIDMESLPSGTYYLNLFSAKQMLKSFKVVKMRK